MNNKFILLAGRSGTGKSTVANILTDKYNLKQVQSYTTRPMRYRQETGHIFLRKSEYKKYNRKDMVAYTYFNSNHYFATEEQVKNNDVYIIDKDGIKDFKKNYKGDKEIVVVLLIADDTSILKRMNKRGDTYVQMLKRLKNDRLKFKGISKYADYVIFNKNHQAEETADKIWEIIND